MPLLFEKKLINIELYMPEAQIEEEDEQSTEDQKVSDQPTEYAIEVRGMKPTLFFFKPHHVHVLFFHKNNFNNISICSSASFKIKRYCIF
jgi:hypothetical protein